MSVTFVIAQFWKGLKSQELQVLRFEVDYSNDGPLVRSGKPLAISPDGTKIVYTTVPNRLYLRHMDNLLESKPLPGTDGAQNPSFSADSKWIVFWANGKVKKVSVSGGEPENVYDMNDPLPKTAHFWTEDNKIVFAHEKKNKIFQIEVPGRIPDILNKSDSISVHLAYPQLLPDKRSILFDFKDVLNMEAKLVAFDINTGEYKNLIDHYGHAQYLRSGHIINGMYGELLAIPFSLDETRITGPAVSVIDGVLTKNNGSSFYSISNNGTLIYPQGGSQNSDRNYLEKVEMSGRSEIIQLPVDDILSPRISPDGRYVAFHAIQETRNIWIFDIEQKTSRRLTDDQGDDSYPVWSVDGKEIYFSTLKPDGKWTLVKMSIDGKHRSDILSDSTGFIGARSLSPDGKFLTYEKYMGHNTDIFILPLHDHKEPFPFIQSPYEETASVLSPNGQWIAYCGNESGQIQVYVRKYPGSGGFRQVSTEGGLAPLWAPDGQTLYYRSIDSNRIYAISFETKPYLNIGQPKLILEGSNWFGRWHSTDFDISPDGSYFLLIRGESRDPQKFIIVYNWFEEMKEKMVAAGIN